MLGNVAYAEQAYSEVPPIVNNVRVQLPTPNAFIGSVGSVAVNEVLVSGVSATVTLSTSYGINQFICPSVSATVELGTVSVQELNVSGVQGNVEIGQVLVWGPLIDLAFTSWSAIDPNSITVYSDIDPDTFTVWSDIGGMNG